MDARYNLEAAERLNTDFDISELPQITTLDSLVKELRMLFSSDDVNIEYVVALMTSYKSNPEEWRKFANFDEYKLTKNLIDEGNGRYDLILVCWGEGHASTIHDHSDSHCFMKTLQGSLQEVRFAWPKGDDEMIEIGKKPMKLNSVVYMSDALGLHRVENPSKKDTAVSLHLYCPPITSCHMFDKKTGHPTNCQTTFWSKYGKKDEI